MPQVPQLRSGSEKMPRTANKLMRPDLELRRRRPEQCHCLSFVSLLLNGMTQSATCCNRSMCRVSLGLAVSCNPALSAALSQSKIDVTRSLIFPGTVQQLSPLVGDLRVVRNGQQPRHPLHRPALCPRPGRTTDNQTLSLKPSIQRLQHA